jgi:catechol 1,2-dioxygenase
VVSELCTHDDPYLHEDAVFGVKSSLVVRYSQVNEPGALRRLGADRPFWELEHDIILVPGRRTSVSFTTSSEK